MRVLSSLPSLCCCAAVLAGCKERSRSEGATIDTTASAMADTAVAGTGVPAARTITPADLAGRWSMRSVPETGGTTTTTYVLAATTDTTRWTITFPNRKPVAARIVAVGGDSIVTEAGPFESARRKGVKVRTHTVLRRVGDRLVGTTVAHYVTKGADSVLTLRTEGTRAAK
jgi:hypothetical protein